MMIGILVAIVLGARVMQVASYTHRSVHHLYFRCAEINSSLYLCAVVNGGSKWFLGRVSVALANGSTISMSVRLGPEKAEKGYSTVVLSSEPLGCSVDVENWVCKVIFVRHNTTAISVTPVQFGYISMSTTPIFVSFTKNFANPVVVLGPATFNGSDPCEAYVLNVTSSGFYARLYEFNYEDGPHLTEDVGYLVVEAGIHVLPDGRLVEAGYVNATTTRWIWVSFPKPFNKTPVVIASLASRYSDITVVPRIKGVNTTGFWIELEPQESLIGKVVVTEKIAWVAVESGTSSLALVGTVKTPVTTLPKVTITFNANFAKAPVVLATAQTFSGGDTFVLRLLSLSASQATIMLQEDQSRDSEQWHVSETIGYIAISQG